jgi:hypothetical protein
MRFVLLVTWIMSRHPPSSYQVEFDSEAACESARIKVLLDGKRLKDEFHQILVTAGRANTMFELAAPTVSAICSAK